MELHLEGIWKEESDHVDLFVSTGDSGGAVFRMREDGKVDLFEIPMYGGEEMPSGTYNSILEALKEAASWT